MRAIFGVLFPIAVPAKLHPVVPLHPRKQSETVDQFALKPARQASIFQLALVRRVPG